MEIRVYPGATNPTHEISLSDGVRTFGLHLDGSPEALREEPLTPSTLRPATGLSGFGAWEPGMAQIEQHDWSGGRGLETFSVDEKESTNRFYDSLNAWTLTPGKLHPGPQMKFADGLRSSLQHLPGGVMWKGLFGEQRFISAAFTTMGTFAARQARVWLRRVGSPGALSLLLYNDGSDVPGSSLLNAGETISIADVPDVVSQFWSFDLSAWGGNLSASTTYHIVISSIAADNTANHWEIGADENGSGGHASENGASWNAVPFSLYYRLEDADTARSFIFFRLGGSLYAVDQRSDGSASHVYINGDHGVATAAAAGSLTDTRKSWSAGLWVGAWVRIVKGKGAGQIRQILSNSTSTLNCTAWDLTPDGTSEYVIYATEEWKDISPGAGDLIDGVVRDVAVVNDHAMFAQGDTVPILRMRFNAAAGTPAHEFDDDGTNVADLLHSFHHPQYGPQVWRALLSLSEISRATPTAWLTALTFGAGIEVGEKNQTIRKLFDWNSQLWVLKTDSFWQVSDSDQAKRINAGIGGMPREANGQPLVICDGKVHFGWGPAVLVFDGSKVTDLGPTGRQGDIAALQMIDAKRLVAGVDAGDGRSSLMMWDGTGWHELLSAPQPNQGEQAAGLRALVWQECPGARPRLWLALGGDLACVDLPGGSDPLVEENFAFQHEAVLVGGTIDMGAAQLPKFIKSFNLLSANLSSAAKVELDYQIDAEIGGEKWRRAGTFYSSPLDTLALNLGNLHSFRPRLRLLLIGDSPPPVVLATVLEGFARTPLKYQWTIRARLANSEEENADDLLTWLQQAARQARKVRMRSIWSSLDDKTVIVEPPSAARETADAGGWAGTAEIKLREA